MDRRNTCLTIRKLLVININDEHVQDYSCPRATFAFCSHRKKELRQGGLPVVLYITGYPPLEVARGNKKSYKQLQASDRASRLS